MGSTRWSATVFLLVCALSGCGMAVQSGDDGSLSDASRLDGEFVDGVSVVDGLQADEDASLVADGSGGRCRPLLECPADNAEPRCPEECGGCAGTTVYTGSPMDQNTRIGFRRCIHIQVDALSGPGYLGSIGCNEPDFVARFQGADDRRGICVARSDCVLLNQIAQATPLGPNESIQMCRNSDGTLVTAAEVPQNGVCDPMMGYCASGCPCLNGNICAFISERSSTGVCVPQSLGDVSRGCRAFPNRVLCPSADEGCLLPTRRNFDIPDRERFGVCVPRLRCHAVARNIFGFYVCDDTLHI